MQNFRIYAGVAVLAASVGGCATTGATYRSGVGDSFHEHAPYYAGARSGDSAVAHLPVQYQRGAAHAAMFDPSAAAGSPVAALLEEMTAYLDSLSATPLRLDPAAAGTPPDVHFGCEADMAGDCTNGPAAPFEWGKPRMRLAVGRPSADWTVAVTGALRETTAARVLVITLEVGQYWPQQTNWRGSKAVELGSGFTTDLPWLSSLETPVTVLQLTGALMSRDGRAVRIGAEGMLARRTGILAAGFGAQALITDEDVEQLRSSRRDDLPGRPLVWQVALRNLVEQLTGRPVQAN
ncbi:MAG TPA: hypothetical protein VK912_15415 [Longimicrobiales bacterium]|nr:hypothetical protein [Longimicrobiales bacterium]